MPESHQTNEQARNEVRAALEQQRQGFYNRDAAAVAELYSGDAKISDLAPPLIRKFDEAGLALWLSSWDGPVEVTGDDISITIDGDLAVCFGHVHVRTRTQEGEDASWWMRTTICLRREIDAWKIFHEHESVPFYMDGSFKAALDLLPQDYDQ